MMCKSPTLIKIGERFYKVPCKKCIPCKINKTSEWNMRIIMEKQTNPVCQFVTLTYNQDNLPEDRSLHKEDYQDFIKSYRQMRNGQKIKYFTCGEYGDNPERLTNGEMIKRPHMHSIIFNCDNSLSNREMLYNAWSKCDSWKFFGKTWYKTVGNVTSDSASYVAGYCQKKLFGDKAIEEYGTKIPPFQLQSNGIGEDYFLQNIEKYSKDGFIFYNGVKRSIPETWKRKYDIDTSNSRLEFIQNRIMDFINYYDKRGEKISDEDIKKICIGINRSSLTLADFLDTIDYKTYSDFVDFKNNLKKRGVL